MSDWISVKDRLPEVGIPVLADYYAYNDPENEKFVHIAELNEGGEWMQSDNHKPPSEFVYEPEFWMYLPEPPKEE